MSNGKSRRARRQGRKNSGNQNVLGAGKYGNREELQGAHEFLETAQAEDRAFTPSRLHPSLRHMDPDDEIDVIITSSEGRPEGAGEYLGVLKQDMELPGDVHAKTGMRIWRNARKSRPGLRVHARDILEVITAEQVRRLGQKYREPSALAQNDPVIPAGLVTRQARFRPSDPDAIAEPWAHSAARAEAEFLPDGIQVIDKGRPAPLGQSRTAIGDPAAGYSTVDVTGLSDESARFAEVMEEVSPGLTARLAAGLGQDELDRLAPEIARAMTAAHRREQELADSGRRARELTAGRDPGQLIRDAGRAGAVPVRTNWTADQVLDMHAWLAKAYAAPAGHLMDYLAHLLRGAQEQFEDPTLVNTMFWPVDLQRGLAGPEQGGTMAGVIAHGLRESRTYQVTSPMVAQMRETIKHAAPGAWFLDAAAMPCHAAFTWLDTPWIIREAAGYYMPYRAVSWEKTSPVTRDRNGRLVSIDVARIILWTLINDDIQFGRWDDLDRANRAASAIGQLTPQHITLMPLDREFSVNEGFQEQGYAMAALLHTLWAFLGMELTATHGPSNPVTARRVQKSLKHGQVHIVTLRRISYISDELPGTRDVHWNSRWWVADFYRHIDPYHDEDPDGRRRRHEAVPAARTGYADDDDKHDVCAVCLASDQTVRITPVRGHIRGPSHLPLKEVAHDRTVHRLSR